MNSEDDLIYLGVSAKGSLSLLCIKLAETFRYSLDDFLNCLFKKKKPPQDKASVTLLVVIGLRALRETVQMRHYSGQI